MLNSESCSSIFTHFVLDISFFLRIIVLNMKILLGVLLLSLCSVSADTGLASWYNEKSNFGTETASGIPFDENAMTAASRFHKMGTKVKVTNLKTKKSIIVTITDWGPHPRLKGRIIDLSIGSFRKLCDTNQGLFKCSVEVIKKN